MPFLSGALLSSASTLHPETKSEKPIEIQEKRLRKAQSHASIVAPLLRLARDPVGSLGHLLGAFLVEDGRDAPLDGWDTRKLLLQQRIRDASDYTTWQEAALELDTLEGNDAWKQDPVSPFYDHDLLQLRLKQLVEARLSNDPKRMLFLLRTSLTRGLGNMGDLNLYKYSHIGTKSLIEGYIAAACDTLHALLDSLSNGPDAEMSSRHALERLLETRQSFGRSALLLSGGGTFGMSHIGVVKCLWEAKLLPRIVSGSSAGSIICAVLCARTDAEIPATLQDMCNGDLNVFEQAGAEESFLRKAARFAKHGAIFDIQHLNRVMKGLLGDLTFQEAYNRTRKILNISVSSASLHELPRLLNYVTAPNVIIWSAVAASCSVPLIFSPATILAKDPETGAEVPWNPSAQLYIDGSVDNDLPMTRLAEMFNVNHFIVSQVNPHVVPFLINEETMGQQTAGVTSGTPIAKGYPMLDTVARLAKSEALHRMHVLSELGVFPTYFTKLRSVLSQKYSGDITILPEISYPQFTKVLQNPSPEFMLTASLAGERATWPKLSRVQNHCAIELALDNAVQRLRTHIAFSPSQVDLRMMSFNAHGQLAPRQGRIGRHRNREKTRSFIADPRQFHETTFQQRTRPPPTLALHRQFHDLIEVSSDPADSSDVATTDDSDDEDMGDSQFLSLKTSRRRRDRPIARKEPLYDSSESNFRSYSPSSEPGSPDDIPPTPTVWPTSRQLFPFQSQPVTPFVQSNRRPGSGNPPVANPGVRWTLSSADEGVVDLTMTQSVPNLLPVPAQPTASEAERRYKRLFHPRDSSRSAQSASRHSLAVDIRGVLRRKRSDLR